MKIIIIWPLLNSLQYRENGAYMQAAQVISASYYLLDCRYALKNNVALNLRQSKAQLLRISSSLIIIPSKNREVYITFRVGFQVDE